MTFSQAEVRAIIADRNKPINRARLKFRHFSATLEQAAHQRMPPSPMEVLQMEYDAIIAILNELTTEDFLEIRKLGERKDG